MDMGSQMRNIYNAIDWANIGSQISNIYNKIEWTNAVAGAIIGFIVGFFPVIYLAINNIFNDRYKTYYGTYYSYNWAVAGVGQISEKKMTISRSWKGIPKVTMHIHENNVRLSYHGHLRANHKSLYFDLMGKGHPEELKIVHHEPLDRKIILLTGVFAATTLDCDPLCGKLVISNRRLGFEHARKHLGARNIIIIDSKHQRTVEQCLDDIQFINPNINTPI